MVAERGRILKVYNNVLHVAAEDGVLFCKLRGRVKKGRSDMGLVPGDIVTFERISEGEGVIERIEARTNLLQRPRVANLTQIVITVAAASPDPHPLVVSRFLVLAELSGVKKIVLCVNKVDSFQKLGNEIYEFYQLGLGDPFGVSSVNQLGLGDLLDELLKHFPKGLEEEAEDDRIRVALIGKPNVGKSSMINKLLGENRVIVSEIAGTTRDAIDTEIVHDGERYIFIDTAGLRRKGRVTDEIERYSVIRTVSAVDRADICVVLIDAIEGITEQDVHIAGIAHESGKGVIIAVNKWDAVEKDDRTMRDFTKKLREKLSYMDYAEYLFLSAKTGQRLTKLFPLIDMVHQNQMLRVKTGLLNEIMMKAAAMKQPPSDKGKRLRLFYITQVSVRPPSFVIFVNDRELMHFSYTRYLENRIREAFGFRGTPLRFIIRERGEKE